MSERTVTLEGHHAILHFPYHPKTVELVKGLPGRAFHVKTKTWRIAAVHLPLIFSRLEEAGFKFTREAFHYAERVRAGLKGTYRDVALPLFPFQKEGAAFLAEETPKLLADAPGLGKSLQTMAALRNVSGRILVLCPASLKYSWADEIRKWLPDDTVSVVAGTPKERALAWADGARWTVANYELLLIPDDHEAMRTGGFVAVVADESTRLANARTKTHAALMRLDIPRRIALTGTPLQNSPGDFFGLFAWLIPGFFGTWSWFMETFAEQDHWGNVVEWKNLDLLRQMIAPITLRRTKQEVASDLPAKTRRVVRIALSEGEAKVYGQIRDGLMAELLPILDRDHIDPATLQMAAVRLVRLLQAADDPALVLEAGATATMGVGAKTVALVDILEDHVAGGEKVIVFTRFAEMAKILHARFADSVLYIGEMDSEKRNTVLAEFTLGKAPVLFSSDAGGMGLNLQVASAVVHFDLPWSWARLIQREDRAHRIGQTKPVTVYSLVARKTVDEFLLGILEKKAAMSDTLLTDGDRMLAAGVDQEMIRAALRP